MAKSSLKPISIIGVVYGLALSVAIAATIVRAVFFFTGHF
jgi:high-affinity Fe2+/Pb2+ permease